VALKATRFVADLRKFGVVGIDSGVLIYHLEDTKPYSDLTEGAFAEIAVGALRAVVSTVSATEVLVKPFLEGNADVIAAFERFILSLPNTALVAPDYETSKDAARLRARYALRTPDALLVATARRQAAKAFVTNDAKLKKLRGEGLNVIVLDDYLA
jgi:predicted nucleic acid-binding protein